MKAFIEKVFKSKKLKQETEVKEQATEAMVEAIVRNTEEIIIKELKQGSIEKEEVKKEEVVTYPKPKHFPDCTCFKCDRWRQQNAK
jgi:hypothetical protein